MATRHDVTIRIVTPPPRSEVPVKEWGARVAHARRSRRLSQAVVAQACGVTQQTISKIEHGEICPQDQLKLRLSAALGLPPATLFPWPTLAT